MAEYVEPEIAYTSRVFGLTSGLTGTVRFRLIDNDTTADDPVYGPSALGIVEDPAGSGSYVFTSASVSQLTPATEAKYARVWDEGPATELVADEDMIVVAGINLIIGGGGDVYATADELARRLKIRVPTTEQEAQMDQVLLMATGEINSEIDLSDDADDLAGWQLALTAEVCLERAVELWNEAPFGIIELAAGAFGPTHTARNSWERYAHKLAPLKNQWGVA